MYWRIETSSNDESVHKAFADAFAKVCEHVVAALAAKVEDVWDPLFLLNQSYQDGKLAIVCRQDRAFLEIYSFFVNSYYPFQLYFDER